MKTRTPIILLRGKPGCPVVTMDPSGVPKVLAWIPEEMLDGILGMLGRAHDSRKIKMPRKKKGGKDISFDAFREELLK